MRPRPPRARPTPANVRSPWTSHAKWSSSRKHDLPGHRCREQHIDTQTVERRAPIAARCAMSLGDALDDGQPQASALLRIARNPEKALAQPGQQLIGDARPIVFDAQSNALRNGRESYGEIASPPCVTQPVVDQVVQ